MITQLDLEHFKCFQRISLPLAPLTTLAGLNASGKSSVMQALALLHQTMRDDEWSRNLVINGSSVKLGAVKDIAGSSGRDSFSIGVHFEKSKWIRWIFQVTDRLDMAIPVQKIATESGSIWDSATDQLPKLRHLLPDHFGRGTISERLCRLNYLTAERLGPRNIYNHDQSLGASVIGSKGESALSVLYAKGDEHVMTGIQMPEISPTLNNQVKAYMETIFPGFDMRLEQIPETNSIKLGVRISKFDNYQRPVHCGFGVTQVLPIIISAMSAKENDLLLIENPEVHLHPAGQSQIAQFLSHVASNGVQILIETHSDHILNGIRRAVKEKKISNDDTVIHFFRPPNTATIEERSQVESPEFQPDGTLDYWPKGFFDQIDDDMSYFAGWS